MRIWPLTVIERQIAAQVDARVAEQSAVIRQEAEQMATRRAAEALATAIQGNSVPQGPRPGMYAFDNPFIYSQPHSPRMRPRTKIDLETLRRLADTYDVMRSCINHLKTEVQAVPIKLVAKDAKDDSDATKRLIDQAAAWLDSRAGGLGGFGLVRRHFEDQIFEDALVIGAFAAFIQQTRTGKPYQVVAIDSATIKPKVDPYGWQHPNDAFEQWVQGVNVRPSISMDELIYDGMYPVSSTPYYRSPVEWLAGVTISALKADEWNRTWLTDGNTPDQLIAVPKEWTPEQLQTYAAYFDAMLAGQTADRRKTRLVPDGTKPVWTQSRKDADFQQFELWLMRRTCSIFGVQPASIGYAGEQYKVSQEESFSATSQFGVGRLLAMRADLYNDLLERLGYSSLSVVNVTEGEEEPAERTDRLAKAVGGPWMTPNEARQAEGLEPIEGGDDLVGSVKPDEFDDTEGDMADDEDPDEDEQRAADLRRWERKALSRLREHGSPACEFASEWLNEFDRAEISEALSACSTADDVREVFRKYDPSQPRDANGRWVSGRISSHPHFQQHHVRGKIKPSHYGAFGPVYNQFRGKAHEAEQFLSEIQAGIALGALNHPEVGAIDLPWGEVPNGRKQRGYGLAKILAKHPEVKGKLQTLLSGMAVKSKTARHVEFESETHIAAMRKVHDGRRVRLLVTMFEKKSP